MRDLDIDELDKLRQLNRVKVLASAVLGLCFLAMVLAKILEQSWPAFGIVAAFAEAATIGGIADWYAVVALFKKPLNLPFPHTAIIPNNQHRIADNLGRFIETNFLARAPVQDKLKDVDFAGEMAVWLSSRNRAQNLAAFVLRFLPKVLESIDEKGLVQFATERAKKEIAKTEIAPLVGNVLHSFTKDGRHQKLLDDVITALHRFLNDDETLEIVRKRVARELPLFVNLMGGDSLILNRIVRSTANLLNEIKDDRQHPLRAEFEDFLVAYIRRTRRTKGFARQVEQAKQMILARPELQDAAEQMWQSLISYVLDEQQSGDGVVVARLADLFVEFGQHLHTETALRRDINDAMVALLSNLVEDQRRSIAAYVADQVKGWDIRQLLLLIEVNVGRDLQYIRFNGMIIGGCVGVLLFGLEALLLH
jgi:uncharacterized membrane-anchored protein YjiN (DUF445 family)